MNRSRLPHVLTALAVALALAVLAAAALGAGSPTATAAKSKPHMPTVGIGDEQPAMFSNGAYRALDTRIARYVTPYDVMSNHKHNDLPRLRAWLAAAKKRHVQPLVAFYHSDRTPKKMPSVKAYTKAVKAFLKAFPHVRLLQPWDEANRGTVKERGDSFHSPNAKQSAQYYLALRGACRKCTVVGLDVLDSTDVRATLAYINQFKKDVGRKHQPSIWGLHNYSDTNRFHEGGTKAVLADTSGQVWLTETGGIAKLSPTFPFNLSRQSRAVSYMFKLASLSKRITRLYIFQWTGGIAKREAFDAGLTDVHGKPRPAYCVVYKTLRHKKRCPYKTVKD
ncbi:MAG TPA: hypothetical protein VHX66_14780 [Solirubrobacteraceae bacterium]|jgi:hypothetical protein|nr:hypothetical protein [Solirubrobacteraceae bacterium]